MRNHMRCSKCGGILIAQTYTENGERLVDGLECMDCWSKVVTSVMTQAEYRKVLEDYNKSVM